MLAAVPVQQLLRHLHAAFTPPVPPVPPPVLPAASGLDVRYMKILKEEKNYAPSRWFRVVAMANSYQVRPH